MLPTGHIAGGYLAGVALLKIVKPDLNTTELNCLVLWTTFFGFAPDLDVFWYFLRNKNFLVLGGEKSNRPSHRYFLTHAPLLWLTVGVLIFFLSQDIYTKLFGLALWVGSWSHFLLDSIEYGIMWLWPFRANVYALKGTAESMVISETNFFRHSISFLKFYSKTITFYLEILIITIALIIYLK